MAALPPEGNSAEGYRRVCPFQGLEIDELYNDADKFLDRAPRVEQESIAPIVEFMGKKPIPVETIADNTIIDKLVREGFIDQLYKKR
jgi:hypothetical protein